MTRQALDVNDGPLAHVARAGERETTSMNEETTSKDEPREATREEVLAYAARVLKIYLAEGLCQVEGLTLGSAEDAEDHRERLLALETAAGDLAPALLHALIDASALRVGDAGVGDGDNLILHRSLRGVFLHRLEHAFEVVV